MSFRRFFSAVLIFFSLSFALLEAEPSNKAPALLEGIWQGKDRLLLFSGQGEFAVVLRVFYQWYNDRAAEPSSFAEIKSRGKNDASSSDSENAAAEFITVLENSSKTAGIYEISLKYPGFKENYLIPVCVIDGNLYLDFLIKGSAESSLDLSENEKSVDLNSSLPLSQNENSSKKTLERGFYRAASSVASSSGITISPPFFKKEVFSYFTDENGIYKIRYWLSEMEYSSQKAFFIDDKTGKEIFSADKFLKIGANLYQCAAGRGTKIRNAEKLSDLAENVTFDSEKKFAALGEPYLKKVPQKSGREYFLENAEENNKMRKPAPKPLFPPSEINFHWKDISELEKYNSYTWNRRNLDIHK